MTAAAATATIAVAPIVLIFARSIDRLPDELLETGCLYHDLVHPDCENQRGRRAGGHSGDVPRWVMPSSASIRRAAGLGLSFVLGLTTVLAAQSPAKPPAGPMPVGELTGIRLAQHHFYSGRYDDAIALAGTLRESDADALAAFELRTSALHFKIKRLLGDASNKGKAFKACAPCADLQAEFLKDTAAGKALAESRLKQTPDDQNVRYYLGKLDLNYIWLQLATLGKRTGWASTGPRAGPWTPC